MLQDLGKELNKPRDKPVEVSPTATPGSEAKPIPVEVRQPPPTALETIAALIAPLLHPLTTTGIVIIFVIFTLMQREQLRNRLIKLAGSHDLQKTTGALDDAARRPHPCAAERFVPYVGTFISAIFPLALAMAVDPGWAHLFWTLGVFFILEPIGGHLFEPLLYGKSTGLSPLAVVLSATFWTTLWGPIGLALATPLTVCLVVSGRHVDSLKFLDVMFGNRPALSPPEVFYQRMLADDPAEVIDKADEYLDDNTLTSYYDEVALTGLKLAHTDLDRGMLDATHLAKIRNAVTELVEEFEDREDRQPERKATTPETGADKADAAPHGAELPVLTRDQLAPDFGSECPVLCIGGRNALDEAAAPFSPRSWPSPESTARFEMPKGRSSATAADFAPTAWPLPAFPFRIRAARRIFAIRSAVSKNELTCRAARGEAYHFGQFLLGVRLAQAQKVMRSIGRKLRIAGRNDDRHVRPQLLDLRREIEPCHAWHRVVRHDKIELRIGFKNLQRLHPRRCFHHAVAKVHQHVGRAHAHKRIVIHQQHSRTAGSIFGRRFGRGRDFLDVLALGARQPQMDHCPFARLTGDVNGAAGLRGQAMHHGQAQSRPLADAFGREKRLHRPGERRFTHAHAGVCDADVDILSREATASAAHIAQRRCRLVRLIVNTPPFGIASLAFTARFISASSNWLASILTG